MLINSNVPFFICLLFHTFSCPKGFVFKPLCSKTDAEIIDSLWPNRHRGSLFFIKRLIDWNINMGIYDETNNELAAWCLR